MLDIFFYFMVMTFGYMLGKYKAKILFDEKDWKILAWDNTIFGYRVVMPGRTVYRGDKVMVAVEFEKSLIPESGMKVMGKNK